MSDRTITCEELGEHLSLWVGGDLEGALGEALDRHVEFCTTCAVQAGRARAARQAFFEAAQADAVEPVELWPGLAPRLEAEGLFSAAATAAVVRSAAAAVPDPSPRSHPGPQSAWRLPRRPLAAAAALLVLAGAGGWLAQQHSLHSSAGSLGGPAASNAPERFTGPGGVAGAPAPTTPERAADPGPFAPTPGIALVADGDRPANSGATRTRPLDLEVEALADSREAEPGSGLRPISEAERLVGDPRALWQQEVWVPRSNGNERLVGER